MRFDRFFIRKFTSLVTKTVNFFLLISLLVSLRVPNALAKPNSDIDGSKPLYQASTLLAQLTPEQKIGQLFLITFIGNQAPVDSQIELLIRNQHIGGVILNKANDNFIPEDDIRRTTLNLIRELQTDNWASSKQQTASPLTGESYQPTYLPLFIGISQEGDGYPHDQLLSGITSLPNLMTIGATWQTDMASQAGAILGRDLSTLGFNLLLGPALDVLESPHPESGKDMGTRVFGGDPYWVSVMGQSYIEGLHSGSKGTMAVVSKFFPGYGSADRNPEDEVATVRRNLSELKGYDLIPFFSVTGDAPSPEARTDALLASHIRFQGFEETSPRLITKPITLDQPSLQALLELPAIQKWREEKGVVVSDDLGGKALRSYLDLNSQVFDPRRITLNALLAGNDLLYISDFTSADQPDNYAATVDTINYLVQKYREDSAFAEKVDQAVDRILSLKLKLYGNFLPTRVIPNEAVLQVIPTDDELAFTISRNSVTLVNPAQADLDQILPDPPNRTERIVFITDSRAVTQCSSCPVTPVIGVNALEDQIIHRYGPNAGRLVTVKNLSSFSIQDLEGLLNNSEGSYELERKLGLAHWIVFSMLDNSDEYPSYTTLSRFLARRPALIQGKKVIVFAFNAPYYLDSTDISKLTAFYALYNKTNEAVDVAAYVLFRELPATGSLPVSVPGVNYSLNDALFPDPEQVIPLELDLPSAEAIQPDETTTPPPPPVFDIGSIVSLKTGTILDHNGRPVPDGTPVEFTLEYLNEPPLVRQIEYTVQGVATTSFVINAGGPVEFIAQSEQAVSQPLQIEVPIPNEETPVPTSTPEPSPTPTLTPTETVTPSPTATPLVVEQKDPGFPDWLIALIIALITSWLGYRLVIASGLGPWGIRTAALIMIGSLSAYTYLALGFPGSQQIMASSVGAGVVMCSIFGAGLGLLTAFTWRKMDQVTK